MSALLLSGSTNGQPIKVAATSTPGTTVHTAITGTTMMDHIHLWATNTDTVARTLTTEFGGVTDPDNLITKAYSIPPSSKSIKIVDGQPLNNAKVLSAFASSANKIVLTGYALRVKNG